jgi:hypothetical protein
MVWRSWKRQPIEQITITRERIGLIAAHVEFGLYIDALPRE